MTKDKHHGRDDMETASNNPFAWMEEMLTPFQQWQQQWQQQFQEGMQQASEAFYQQFSDNDSAGNNQNNPFLIWQQQFQQGLEKAQHAFVQNLEKSGINPDMAGLNTTNMPFYDPTSGQTPYDFWLNHPLTKNLADLTTRINNQMMRMSSSNNPTGTSVTFDVLDGWRQFGNMMQQHPGNVVEEQTNLWKNQLQLWQNTMLKMAGQNPTPVTTPPKGDKRFADEEWDNNPWYDYLKQNYLLVSEAILEAIDTVEGIDEKSRQRLSFFTRQWINAIAPTNFLFTNPEVLRLTLESQGQNLVNGMKQLAEDLENSADTLNIRMTDQSAFRVGDNIATTPGKVVYQNHMFELIQYTPTTDKVSKKPLLLVPPWINKFYIMDLREKNSFIRWAVEQGHTVFVISWVNPTRAYKDIGMADYMHDGVIAAMDEIERITGESQINISGYCIGGMLTALTLAWLTEKGQADRIASATLWATIIDFTDPGDIGVFIDERIVDSIDKQNSKEGVFDGRMMGVAFSMLRENSLYWNYFIQNYLKGERPVPFDLLYWNSDCTNVTAALHRFLLHKFYLDNLLMKEGELELDGVKIDLRKVKTPVFMVATLQDHIAKWRSCYSGTQVFGGDTTFVLGESGHIAGIMNPPTGKYGYYMADDYPADADAWYEKAEYVEASWWLKWQDWVNQFEKQQVDAREVGKDHKGKFIKTFGDAPGTYVLVKAEEALASDSNPSDFKTSA